MGSADWAAWVQAIGSIAAIGAGFAYVARNHVDTVLREQDAEERRLKALRKASVSLGLAAMGRLTNVLNASRATAAHEAGTRSLRGAHFGVRGGHELLSAFNVASLEHPSSIQLFSGLRTTFSAIEDEFAMRLGLTDKEVAAAWPHTVGWLQELARVADVRWNEYLEAMRVLAPGLVEEVLADNDRVLDGMFAALDAARVGQGEPSVIAAPAASATNRRGSRPPTR